MMKTRSKASRATDDDRKRSADPTPPLVVVSSSQLKPSANPSQILGAQLYPPTITVKSLSSISSPQSTTGSNYNNTILTVDHVIENVLRYVGPNQYRFIASISQQYHRIYTDKAMTFITTNCSTKDTAAYNCTIINLTEVATKTPSNREDNDKDLNESLSSSSSSSDSEDSPDDTTETDDSIESEDDDNNIENVDDDVSTDRDEHYSVLSDEGNNITSKDTFNTIWRPKQTYYNVSTINHLTICYNETFHRDLQDGEDYYETKQREMKEGKMKSDFYKTVGRRAIMEQLQYLYNTLHWTYNCEVCTEAAGAGHFLEIQFLYANRSKNRRTALWDVHTCARAAKFGCLNILKYLHSKKCPWDEMSCVNAAKNGHFEFFKYLIEKGCECDHLTWVTASKNGQLKVCKYLEEGMHCSFSCFRDASYFAAMNGHLKLLKYGVGETRYGMYDYWVYITHAAAASGNLRVLKYAIKECGSPNSETCATAAKLGHLHILQYLRSKKVNCSWKKSTCIAAAKKGHLHVLQYAHNNGCPWDASTCSVAAKNGHVEILTYAHNNGCQWDVSTCLAASQNGHLNCLQFAHKNGCPWDQSICTEAAKRGDLTMLQYAHNNGCPWDSTVRIEAARIGHLKMLKFACENGCPLHESVHTYAAKNEDTMMLQYLQENGLL